MTSLLVLFLVSKGTLTVKAIYSQPYFHMCISISQLIGNIGIAVFAGLAVFAAFDVWISLQVV